MKGTEQQEGRPRIPLDIFYPRLIQNKYVVVNMIHYQYYVVHRLHRIEIALEGFTIKNWSYASGL